MRRPSRPLKFLPPIGLLALALFLAGCDRCGDWIKSEGGNAPQVCKSDTPKPN
jgi:hypothetical protein